MWNVGALTMRLTVIIAGALALTACAVGNKHAYHDVVANIPETGTDQVAVAAHDQRPYVLSGQKTPEFVGLSRGGYGNPFDVTTENNRPLAEAMTQAIANSLKQKGFRPIPVSVAPTDKADAVREKLVLAGAERSVLLTLREWKSDTYVKTWIHYDVTMAILDRDGQVVGESQLKGEDDLEGDFVNPPGHAKKVVPAAFKAKLERLLGDPAVVSALGPPP